MLAEQLVNGLMLGGAYALVAIGYTLIFGVLNLLHLAHGEVFMVGAYVGLALALAGFSPWVTLAGAMLAAAVLGVVVERVAFRPVRNRGSHVTPLITTIAVGLVLQRSEEHTSELQSRPHLVCRLLLEKKMQTNS